MRYAPQLRLVREIKVELKKLTKEDSYKKLSSWQKETVQFYISSRAYGFEQGQLRTDILSKSSLTVTATQELWKWDLYYILGEGAAAEAFLDIDKMVIRENAAITDMCGWY